MGAGLCRWLWALVTSGVAALQCPVPQGRTDRQLGWATWRAVAAGPGGVLGASALRNAADEAEVVAAGGVRSR